MLNEKQFHKMPALLEGDCELCEINSSVFFADCFGCHIRHTAILPKGLRTKVYQAIAKSCGQSFAEDFVSRVNLHRKTGTV